MPPQSRRVDASSRHRLLTALAAVICVVVTLGIAFGAELAYRYRELGSLRLPAPMFVPDPDLLYRLNPAIPGFAGGFRGQQGRIAAGAALHVICLGGSTTFGYHVSVDQAWPHVVRTTLEARGIRSDVINAGVNGYGSRQLLIRYRRDLATLQADFVVLYAGWNRTGALVDTGEWVPFDIAYPRDGPVRRALLVLCRHSFLLSHVLQALAERRAAANKTVWSMDRHHETWVEDMRALTRDIAAHGQRPVLVVYPSLYHDGMTTGEVAGYRDLAWEGKAFRPDMLTEIDRKQAAIRQIAAETGAVLIDIQAAFAGIIGPARRALFLDTMHLSVLGNLQVGRLIGTALAEQVRRGARKSP